MATMIPPSVSPDTPASERRVFEKLRCEKGTEQWTVLHSLAISSAYSGQFGEIDFVVIVPGVGMVCVEVKGGGVSVHGGVWTTRDRFGVTSVLKVSPFTQVQKGMWKILQAIEMRFGRGANEMRCPVGWMLAFPDIVCPPVSAEFRRREVIDSTDMTKDIADLILGAPSLVTAASVGGKQAPTAATCRSLVEFLRPSFERPETEASRIWDAERRIIELSTEQFEVLEGLLENDRVFVHGAAGTGKTLLAVEAARRFARNGSSVLLTCFNRRLGEWLRDSAAAFRSPTIRAGNLHKILRDDILRSRYADILDESGSIDFNADFYALASLAEIDIAAKYDIVIIDEVQDFDPAGLSELVEAWKSVAPSCRLLMFGDLCRQSLYDASAKGRDDIKRHFGALTYFGLTVNRRNTRRITRTIDSMTGLTGAKLSDRAPEGEPVATTFFGNAAELVAKVNQTLSDLRMAGYGAKDIVILGPHRFENSNVAGHRRLGGFEFGPIEAISPKGVGYATIHSFKGLERNVVLLIDVTVDDFETSDALLYVGLSRAKLRLFLFVAESSKARLNDRIAYHLRESLGAADAGY